ncbi:Gfo/Idh/MocA family oxidoreductase [Paenibacillus zeisoli]|uniref:Gfo/Idh/MocA family oxidoreductase n=1 Tax=Paenibacillus zeisoli TaxID=2496267 RepID=A0A433XQ70_9BACL|nr:Gfo/Idh/MocA family oxidoreductase [Paenibacillus zeisoli]RUT36217.1 Gfo/Idh/MocA family oxidoreductase [Paenibacillus zeisoli]
MIKLKAGIIGCGNISPAYLTYLSRSPFVQVTACADMVQEKAKERAQQFGIENVYTVEEMLNAPEIDLIINLTIPASHGSVNLLALQHGKHVYVEKPLCLSLDEAKDILALAAEKGLRVGSAPDTFLGAGIETARDAIARGFIGRPVAASAFMMGSGPESWHPNPDFFYAAGGGPMFDMGPYYLTALINLLGPIRRISGSAGIQVAQRTVHTGENAGKSISVQTPTHYSGTLEFAEGAIGTMITSFDITGGSMLPWIEIYGTEGSLHLPDPNYFNGEVKLRRSGNDPWEIVPALFESGENERGRGVEDMAKAIHEGVTHRANGHQAYHVLEAMHAFERSSREGKHIMLESTADLAAYYMQAAQGIQ